MESKFKRNPWRPVFPPASGRPNIPTNTSIRSSPPPLTGNHKTMNNAIATAERETNEVIEFLKSVNEKNIRTDEIMNIVMAPTFRARINRVANYLRAQRDKVRVEELLDLSQKIVILLDNTSAITGGRRRSYRRKHKQTRKTRRTRTRKN